MYRHGHSQGRLGPWSQKYFMSIISLPFCQIYKKVVLRLSGHGDVIETEEYRTSFFLINVRLFGHNF